MNIEETLEYIHHTKWQGSKPGLTRTRRLLEALGSPDKSLKFVHIAGTNGKGSTAACIESILRAAGYKTGLNISPYVSRFNERIQVCGEQISDDDLIKLVEIIMPHADAMEDSPTEFELVTALAMLHFCREKCDIVVLETGMGGELDSTNAIDVPEVAVITSIGYDHVKELGPTIEDIARAKAGIIKGGDVVIYGGSPEVEAVFEKSAALTFAKLRRADFSRISNASFSLKGLTFDFSPYGNISLPLIGTYQPKNAAVAITAVEVLREKGFDIANGDIARGLACVYWPGRFEILGYDPVFILDGAHNPQCAKVAAESLRCYFGEQKVVFIVGVMRDKDIDSMMDHIAPLAKEFIAVSPDNPRAMDAKTLADKLGRFGVPVSAFESIESGVKAALGSTNEDGIICALGSLYFSNDIREAVNLSLTSP